ncbi:MAG: hypothetical protein ACO1RT_12815 [Planctomycetaceae bacterium]
MPSWMLCIETLALPLIGSVALGLSKLTHGPMARISEQWFLGVLLAVTLITCRTVISAGECWLAHTSTLGLMIVGSLLLPDRDSLLQRRITQSWR